MRHARLLTVLVTVGVLAACGGADDDDPAAPTDPAADEATTDEPSADEAAVDAPPPGTEADGDCADATIQEHIGPLVADKVFDAVRSQAASDETTVQCVWSDPDEPRQQIAVRIDLDHIVGQLTEDDRVAAAELGLELFDVPGGDGVVRGESGYVTAQVIHPEVFVELIGEGDAEGELVRTDGPAASVALAERFG